MSLPRARQASTMRPLWRRAIPGNLTPSAPSSAFRARPCPGRADAPEQGAPGANGRTFGSTLDLDVPQVNPQDTPAPMSASFLARAIARADTFDLGAARKRRDTRAMDIDIPLDGDGTANTSRCAGKTPARWHRRRR